MNRLYRYTASLLAFLPLLPFFSSCSIDPLPSGVPDVSPSGIVSYNADGTMNARVQMEIPKMSDASLSSRAMGETPNYEDLGIYMLVFEENEGLKQFARLSAKDYQSDEHGRDPLVTFTAVLEPTERPVSIHLIATDQPEFSKQINFGMEERVVTSLYTDDNHEAYWQRIVPGCNIPSREKADRSFNSEEYNVDDAAKAAAIGRSLSHIVMIRNFCKVSVRLGDVQQMGLRDFTLTGIYVVNTYDRGSVAPFVAGNEEGRRFVDNYADLDYRQLTDEVKFIGHLPSGVTLINKVGNIQTKSEDPGGHPAPVYFYESPARITSTDRTYVIIRGTYQNQTSYYKLDLGHIYDNLPDTGENEMIGLFEYYNLLRNFNYDIVINSVDDAGYSTFDEAVRGAVFNNFSASVEARNMKSISDGYDMIFVNFTSHVFMFEGDTVSIFSQYRTDISNNGGTVRNDLIKAVPGEGNVIKTYVGDPGNNRNTNDKNYYNRYLITANEPNDDLQRQEFYVYRGNKGTAADPEYGLYRIVTLFLHKPWKFRHMDTFPGLWPDSLPANWNDTVYREIGQSKGDPLTLFFELPHDLPQALFPLEFVIESDRQNIQNAYIGNAVVRSVSAAESLFKDDANPPKTSRIQYVKTVSWEDYYGEWSEDLVGSGTHIVRCRFRTITDLAQDGVGNAGGYSYSETRLRVYNEYFKNEDGKPYHEDGFIRDTRTSDPSPRFWNFNSGLWDEVESRYEVNTQTKDYLIYQDDGKNMTDGLILVDATEKETVSRPTTGNPDATVQIDKPTIQLAQDETAGVRYLLVTKAGDKMIYRQNYSPDKARKIRIIVMSADNSGNSAPPKIGLKTKAGSAAPVNSTPSYTSTDDKTEPYLSYIYDVNVPAAVTEVEITFQAPDGNPVMRFYKIDFHPRFGDFDEVPEQS